MRTGDLPVLQSPGPRLARKPSAGLLSMSQSNPCSPWVQCWFLGPFPERLMGTGWVRVMWGARPQWPRLCGWGDNSGTLWRQQQLLELKGKEGSRDKCDRMSWRHWWERAARLGVAPGEGLWTGTPAWEGNMAGSTEAEKAERGIGDEEPNREGSRANTKEKGNTEMLFIKFVLPTLCSEWNGPAGKTLCSHIVNA